MAVCCGNMYVSYLQLEKDPPMFPHQNPGQRAPGLGLSPQNFTVPGAPQYQDFPSYHHHHHHHHHPGLPGDLHAAQQASPGGSNAPGAPVSGWSSGAYPPPPTRDDWPPPPHPYAASGPPSSGSTVPSLGFSSTDFPGQAPVLLPASLNASAGQISPGSPQRRNPYDWIRRSSGPPANPNGKTRTKDKYRVVYTDHQRLELEKEFHYSKYITIRRKAELATTLGLSERQVKIWFQNRRAKERKINKKKQQQPASSTTTTAAGLHGNGGSSGVAMVTSSSGSNGLLPLSIKEEY